MADLRVFSYLPNPRLAKATIAARISGASIEIVGAKPPELVDWLWDYEARPLSEADKEEHAHYARQARTGFRGTLYKTDAFLSAHPFGAVPAAFVGDGAVGVFESNAIMRAAARLGPKPHTLLGSTPLEALRVDSFLDRTLTFGRDSQRYLLAGSETSNELHAEMENALAAFAGGIEQALSNTAFVAGDALTLADICVVCELCLLSNEARFAEALAQRGLDPLVPQLFAYPKLGAHVLRCAEDETFNQDLQAYLERLKPIWI